MMSPLQVRPDEGKGLRLFQLHCDADDLKRLQAILQQADAGLASGRLADLLGGHPIDATRLEIFEVEDLDGFGLFNYLVKANGLPEAALDPDRAAIEALTGPVLVLYSGAYHDQHVTMSPAQDARLIGAWDEDLPPLEFTPLRAQSAKGTLTPAANTSPAPQVQMPRWLWILGSLVGLAIIALIAALRGATP